MLGLKRFVSSHLQVGVNVNLDATYLERDYGVQVANTVDLRTFAREGWVETPCRSLAGMTSSLLGKQLPKDPIVRLSRWSDASLSDDQVIVLGFGACVFLSATWSVAPFLCLCENDVLLMPTSVTPCRGRCRCSMPAWMRTRPFSFIRR